MTQNSLSISVTRLAASQPRRLFAYVTLMVLGAILLFLLFRSPPDLGWGIAMGAIGIAALVLAETLRRATLEALVLTEVGLEVENGPVLARWEDITSVSRGTFALKPSNGFVVVLAKSAGIGWAPGMWWRFGRRIGIGGVTSGPPAKFMAEAIAERIKT
ncbi:MAG: hypothetical protein EBT13_02520 [Rhodobacteraceae bacterium]|nr:hypothetical protein [Paracoccaceae bacterium]